MLTGVIVVVLWAVWVIIQWNSPALIEQGWLARKPRSQRQQDGKATPSELAWAYKFNEVFDWFYGRHPELLTRGLRKA